MTFAGASTKEVLYGRHYATFADFRPAIDACLTKTQTEHRARLKSLTIHTFQMFNPASRLTV